jgi:hypothetical protein
MHCTFCSEWHVYAHMQGTINLISTIFLQDIFVKWTPFDNILRFPQDKNNDRLNNYLPFLFDDVIDSLGLKEINMLEMQFTWAHNRPVSPYEKPSHLQNTSHDGHVTSLVFFWRVHITSLYIRKKRKVFSEITDNMEHLADLSTVNHI